VKNQNIVLVRLNSGWFETDVPRFGIIDPYSSAMLEDIGGGMQGPSAGFTDNMVLTARKAGNWNQSNAPHGGFLITCEPIKRPVSPEPGSIGRAWHSGYCPVKIQVVNDKHEYADADRATNEYTHLISRRLGPCKIIWKESGTGLKWAIVYHCGTNPYFNYPQFAFVKLTNVTPHPMVGRVQYWDSNLNMLRDTWQGEDEVEVYRYPTYTNNDLYEVNNIVAAVRVDENKYITLHTVPMQFAVDTYSQL